MKYNAEIKKIKSPETNNQVEIKKTKRPEANMVKSLTSTVLASLMVLTLPNPKLSEAKISSNLITQNLIETNILEKQEIKKDKTKEFKSILDITFDLEGHEKNQSITEASYHGNEDFMTTSIGITEETYMEWQLQKGVKEIKPLTEISEKESYEIIREMFWNKIEGYEYLPESIMLMRFQAIWNLGEGSEPEIWKNVITRVGVFDPKSVNLETQSKIVKIYAEEQIEFSKQVHTSKNLPGIINRINTAEEQALSLTNPVSNK